jgi:hypothetical protein
MKTGGRREPPALGARIGDREMDKFLVKIAATEDEPARYYFGSEWKIWTQKKIHALRMSKDRAERIADRFSSDDLVVEVVAA